MTLLRSFLILWGLIFLGACSATETPTDSVIDNPYFLSQDKMVDIDGLKIRYRDEGPQTAETLILVHGFTSSLETWDALANNLKQDFRLIRLDLPGHGLTGADTQKRYSVDETVMFLSHFIDVLEIEKPVLIGNSLGGLVSWRLAAKSPENVSKLVLISPGGFSINGVTEKPVEVPMMLKFYLKNAPLAGVKQATQALFSNPEKLSEERINTIQSMMLYGGNGEAFIERLNVFTLPDPEQDLANVRSPTLIVWGENDSLVPSDHGAKFVKHMPNAELITYPDTGHTPQEEAPEKLAFDIRRFLEAQE